MGSEMCIRDRERAGVVSSNDMTLEATACKIAYLMGRGDLSRDEIADLMTVSMRGEGEIHLFCVFIMECLLHKYLLTPVMLCSHAHRCTSSTAFFKCIPKRQTKGQILLLGRVIVVYAQMADCIR